MRKHLPIALAGAALLAGATGAAAQAAPGAKGPRGGDVQEPARLRQEVGGREADRGRPGGRAAPQAEREGRREAQERQVRPARARDHGADDDRADRLLRPQAQHDPGARPHGGQQHLLDAGLHAPALPGHAVRAGRRLVRQARRCATSTRSISSGRFAWDGQVSNWVQVDGTAADFGANEASVTAATMPTARSRAWSKATLTASPLRATTAASTSPRPTRPTATTATATATSTSPTATSTTSASSTRARARTPTAARAGRDLEPPLVRQPQRRAGPAGLHSRAATSCRHRPLGRRLHDRGRERRHGRVRPRVRPRPRPARLLRHHRRSENGTGFWSLMSSGSWGSVRRHPIGDNPMHMDA